MTTGHKATGAGTGAVPPDPAAGLTGDWVARPVTGRPEAPLPQLPPAPRRRRSTRWPGGTTRA